MEEQAGGRAGRLRAEIQGLDDWIMIAGPDCPDGTVGMVITGLSVTDWIWTRHVKSIHPLTQ